MENQPPTESNPNKDTRFQPKPYLKYSSLAFQMLGTIALSIWAGYWLDGYFNFKIPVLTILFAIGGMIAIIYRLIKSVSE